MAARSFNKVRAERDPEFRRKLAAQDDFAETSSRVRELAARRKNALLAWEIWHAARAGKFPMPEWVLNYLDDCAERLLTLAEAPPEKVTDAVADAVGLKQASGSRTPFNDLARLGRQIELVNAVRSLMEEELSFTAAVNQVGASCSSAPTVRRAITAVYGKKPRRMTWAGWLNVTSAES